MARSKVAQFKNIDRKKKVAKGKKQKAKQYKHKVKKQKTGPTKYLKEVRLELNKVSWPSKKEVIVLTVIVLIAVVIFGIFTFLLDISFSKLLEISTRFR